jgi:hypothetical protein
MSGRFTIALLGLLIAALAGGGCAQLRAALAKDPRGGFGTGNAAGQPVTPAELDELTRAFADRYVGLLSSTCDAIKKDNPDAVQRREAQELMLNCAANVYDIASNADAYTRVLDLVVVTTLVSQVWIDDDRAGEVFKDRADVLVRALHHGRSEAWALAAQVLRPDQLDLLDYTIWDWRRHNPDMVQVTSVRFSNFAIGRGKSATAEVLAAAGLFKNVGQAGQAVDEARQLTERMFYMLKREPGLIRWQAEALKDGMVATPEVGKFLLTMDRQTEQLEKLPGNVAAERKAILAAFDERQRAIDSTVAAVGAALAESQQVAAAIDEAGQSLNEMLRTADGLVERYDGAQRKSATMPSRPFDVREYTQGVKELSTTLQQLGDVIKSSDELLASSQWGRRIEQVNQSADGRMRVASEQGQLVVDAFFGRLYVVLAAFFGMLILYQLITLSLKRRFRSAAGANPHAGGNGDALRLSAPARRSTGKGIPS